MKKYITRTELAAALGRTVATVANWKRLGCPCKVVKGEGRGRALRAVYCLADVKKWLISRYTRKDFDV